MCSGRYSTHPCSKQQGVALISVLLVFAIVAVITSEIISQHFLDLRRTANTINSKQAYYFALAGEEYARQLLARDYYDADREQSDGFLDGWNQLDQSLEIEQGELEIVIEDLQGKFNLNSLLSNSGNIDPGNVRVFDQLLSELGLAGAISPQLQDWLDADNDLRPSGAESPDYQSQSTAYLASNQALTDVSELYLLAAMNVEGYRELSPSVAALPPGTALNINTLRSSVLAALVPQITETQLKQFDKKQQAGGYTTVSDWLGDSVGQYLSNSGAELAVRSQYFQARITAHFAGRISQLQTTFYRDPDNGEIRVLNRQNRFE
jgi:general secretion pathway protein K